MKYDVVIVGAGIAGLTAAIYACRAGKSVLVLESRIHGGQIINTVNIENWPAEPGISGVELMNKIYHQAIDLGAEVEYDEVVSIEKDRNSEAGDKGFVVRTEDEEYTCEEIILAMGTEPRQLSAKQMKDAGRRAVSYCATCDGALYKGKPVVVVGSGNTAKHEIRYLENIASKVYHIHHDDPIPEDAEAVFVAIGRVPNTKVVDNLVELNPEGYIVAGENCRTSCPGVYVAGDCRTKDVRQLVTAAGDGAAAAGNLS